MTGWLRKATGQTTCLESTVMESGCWWTLSSRGREEDQQRLSQHWRLPEQLMVHVSPKRKWLSHIGYLVWPHMRQWVLSISFLPWKSVTKAWVQHGSNCFGFWLCNLSAQCELGKALLAALNHENLLKAHIPCKASDPDLDIGDEID